MITVTDKSEFATVLRQRLDGFFIEHRLSLKADSVMTAKLVVGLLSFATSAAALYMLPLTNLLFVALYITHGLTHLFLLLNIAHDTNHNAISQRQGINKALSYVFDLCGINSYMWRILHNKGHHPNINLVGTDEDIIARGYIRLSPGTPRKARHAYQHFYAWFLYGFSTLDYVLLKDLEYFFLDRYGPLSGTRIPLHEYLKLFAGKLLYFTYMLVLPMVVLGIPPIVVLAAFVGMHFTIGLLAQLAFQPAHAVETSQFPATKDEFGNYTYHILATTADYATGSSFAKWFLGGLNHHVVHHLCPGVCHTHYPALTRIVKDTARQYDVPYREHKSFWTALGEHFALLKSLSLESLTGKTNAKYRGKFQTPQ